MVHKNANEDIILNENSLIHINKQVHVIIK